MQQHRKGRKMVKTVKITAGNQISVVKLPSWSLKARAKEIDAEYIEIVKTKRMYDLFGEMVVIIVDDSGLVENKQVNPCASYLYGADQHGEIIAGDVLLGVQKGLEVLPPDHPEELLKFLILKFPMLQKI